MSTTSTRSRKYRKAAHCPKKTQKVRERDAGTDGSEFDGTAPEEVWTAEEIEEASRQADEWKPMLGWTSGC